MEADPLLESVRKEMAEHVGSIPLPRLTWLVRVFMVLGCYLLCESDVEGNLYQICYNAEWDDSLGEKVPVF